MHKAFFGDRERDFVLTPHLIPELERLAGRGIAAIVSDADQLRTWSDDINTIIRLGLIGGGASPQEADALVKAYVPARPLSEAHLLALEILLDLWNGPAAEELADLDHAGVGVWVNPNDDAAATGDLGAAINAGAA
jgi:hypothetical protein